MDSSLDEIIGSRPPREPRGRSRPEPRRPPPPSHMRQAPRRDREEYPRDGIRKNRYDEPVNLDNDWVHDRFEEDRYERDRPDPRAYDDYERRDRPSRTDEYGISALHADRPVRSQAMDSTGTKIRVDNIHFELTESDIRELFERIAHPISVRMLYDRSNRPTGTAFAVYQSRRDALDAVDAFNGQTANGQTIRMTIVPNAPAAVTTSKGTLFDRIERPSRSLFDRINDGPDSRDDSREDDGARRRRGRHRSESPRIRPAPENVDRYVGAGRRASRSPMRRPGGRGAPRESGRRPGQRRDESGRGGAPPRRGRTDEEGRTLIGGRPRKTAEELDAEMADYWGKPADASVKGDGTATTAATNGSTASAAAPAAAAGLDDDIDMIS